MIRNILILLLASLLFTNAPVAAIDFSDRNAADTRKNKVFQKPLQELADVLDSAWKTCYAYNDLYYGRKEYIRDFFSKNLDSAFFVKNRTALNRLENSSYTLSKQRSILAGILGDSSDRKELIKKFFPPEISKDILNEFTGELGHLLLCLRGPMEGNNFRYGRYIPEKKALGDEHRFTCYQPEPSLQTSELSIEGPFHALRFASPDHFKLFRGNCDTRIKSVVIRALKDNVEHRMIRTPDTLLKRGRYFDINFGRVVDSAQITIIYNVKKDHIGRAVFSVSPVMSSFKDSQDSPYYAIVEKIKSFKMPAGFKMIDRELKQMIFTVQRQLSALSKPFMNPYSDQEELIAVSKERAEYFFYLLKDTSVDRKRLIKKFSEILDSKE